MAKRNKMTKDERGARWAARKEKEAAFYGRVAQAPVTVYHGPAKAPAPTPRRK